jgi:ribokinase
MYDVITIGDATFDTFIIIDDSCKQCSLNRDKNLLCLNFADKICLTHIDQSIGGNATNVAAGIKKLGLSSAIVTELGDDINGYAIEQELVRSGVDTAHVKVHKNKETRFSIVLNYQAERTILSYHAKRQYSLPKRMPRSHWVYYTSLSESFERLHGPLRAHLTKYPKTKLAFNPGSHQLRHGMKQIHSLLTHVDLLFVNVEEGRSIVGRKLQIPALIKALHKKGPKVVVVTNSTKGSYASDGLQTLHMLPYPIKPIAKTGAGDAYASGFLAAMIHGKKMDTAMKWGTANAGGVIQKIGAHRGLQTVSGVTKTTRKYAKTSPKKI